MELDYRNFFLKLGKNIVLELQRLMYQQTGVDGNEYKKLQPKTVLQKIKERSATPALRMIRTGDFVKNAFEHFSSKNYTEVFISNTQHGRALRNAKKPSNIRALSQTAPLMTTIAERQNNQERGLFFPLNIQHISNLESMQDGIRDFKTETDKQTKQLLEQELRLRVKGG